MEIDDAITLVLAQRENKKGEVLPGLEPGFWEDNIRIPSDNRYTTGPPNYVVFFRMYTS